MAKEMDKVQEQAGAVANEIKNESKVYMVKRSPFGKSKDGKKTLYDYYTDLSVKRTNPKTNEIVDKETRINWAVDDNGAYDLLELIYMFGDEAQLMIEPYEMTIDKRKISGYRYKVFTTEESTGEVIACAIKPREKSDASKIENFIVA